MKIDEKIMLCTRHLLKFTELQKKAAIAETPEEADKIDQKAKEHYEKGMKLKEEIKKEWITS